ncbi:MAG: hypothetical protein KKA42_09940 [candidate division Zixibacteria bacterium]|nr:hypothetical protein [candidate division Zixibacteria bacterium]
MRLKVACVVLGTFLVMLCSTIATAQETEQDIVNRYLQKTEAKHTKKLGWASVNFSVDRINRNNDYNSFATYETAKFDGAEIAWLDQGYSLGADFGMMFNDRIAWSLGGEYWMQMGSDVSGSYDYLTAATPIENPESKVQVYGASTTVRYYLVNPPKVAQQQKGFTISAGGTVGYYLVDWDLWQQYDNLNLATSTPTGSNTTFSGTAPGLGFDIGVDYPLGLWDLSLGSELGYFYLNFGNVSWYNDSDEEIIATYNGNEDGRVDLNFSGVRAKLQLRRYFSF